MIVSLSLFSALPTAARGAESGEGKALSDRVLVVGSELDYPPFAIVNEAGEADGFSVDLFKAVARVMGLRIRFRVGPWEEVRTALERGEIDALPLVSYSAEREKTFDFTTPHTVSYATIFIRRGEAGFDSASAMRGRRIIVMQSDATHDYLLKQMVSDRLILVRTVPEALRRLSAGEGEMALVPRLVGLLTANRLGLNNLEITGPRIDVYGRGYGFAVHEGNAELLAHLNQGLSIVKATGLYDELYDKWFGVVDPRGVPREVIRKYAVISLLVFSVILAVALLWTWSLKREIAQRKRAEHDLLTAKRHAETAREEAEAAREAAEAANRAKSTFLANMSHELRTPLHAILGFSQLISRDPSLNSEHLENLGIIGRSGEHLLSVINGVLEMSKIEAGKIVLDMEGIDLPRLFLDIEGMMRDRAEGKGLAFTLSLPPDLPRHVRADAGKLRQVLINLIGNAIKFTKRGTVGLEVHAEEAGATDRRLWCEVTDTGIGISQDELNTIFDPFVQAGRSPGNMQGTGLGLSISRHYVELMGGGIEVASQPDHGSSFRFHIPVTPLAASEFQEQKAPRRVVGLASGVAPPRILIVEDVRESRLLLKKMLQLVGFEVAEAENGAEALEWFQRWRPQLIWMDMRMPVMDGYEATRRIKDHPQGGETVVVALTASVFESEQDRIRAAGCDDCLSKPFQERELFDCMAKWLKLDYRYEEGADVEGGVETVVELDRKAVQTALAALPDTLREELKQVVMVLETEAIGQVIAKVGEENRSLAETLGNLLENYQLETLSTLMDTVS